MLDAFVAASGSAGSGLSLDARTITRKRAGSDNVASDAAGSAVADAGSGLAPDASRTGLVAGSDSRASSAAGGVPPTSVVVAHSAVDHELEFFGDDPFDESSAVEGADDAGEGNDTVVVSRRDLVAEAHSLEHQLLHATKNPHCPLCVMAFGQRKPNRTRKSITQYENFGDAVTMDHVDANSEEMRSIEGDRDLLVI